MRMASSREMWADGGGWAGVSACAGAGGDAGAGLCWPAASTGKASRINPERLRCFKGGLLIRPFRKGRIATAMGILVGNGLARREGAHAARYRGELQRKR